MSKTVADASRDYRQRQRAKLARYEAALREIEGLEFHNGGTPITFAIARTALHIEV